MSKVVNMEGIELEQCVLDNDELNTRYTIGIDPYSEYPITLDESYIEIIPEDEQFVKEYIESDLDSQPDDDNFNKILEESEKELDEMPSCQDYEEWIACNYPGRVIQEDFFKTKYIEYIQYFRKDLKEWWFNKHPQYVTNEEGDVMFHMGMLVTKEDLELGDKVMDMYSNSIDKSIDKELIS